MQQKVVLIQLILRGQDKYLSVKLPLQVIILSQKLNF